MKTYLIFLPALICLVACNNDSHYKGSDEKLAVTEVVLPPPPGEKELVLAKPAANGQIDTEKKIIKEGELRFETRDIAGTRTSINNMVNKLGGYVAEENQTNDIEATNKEYVLNVRIPAKSFDEFLGFVTSGADHVDSKNIRIRDVTTDYIDLNAELTNKKALEARYLELLKRGNKISDLLAIENKVAEIRTDIDATQGKFNYLVKKVEYSSLQLTFYTKQSVKEGGQSFSYKLRTALSQGVEILSVMFFSLLSIWPLWIVFAVCYIVITAWRKKYVKKT